MCGIAGYLNFDGKRTANSITYRMLDRIAHRGPDANGVYSKKNVSLGHCRLSIIDISSKSNQPMSTEDDRFTISYNGEVYNFKELRSELKTLGCSFKTESDTEVVLLAYKTWGLDCFKLLNGMFAIAIWDNHTEELILARDRYGIKPLYFSINSSEIIFASEIKAILVHPRYHKDIDYIGLSEYLTFQNFLTQKTLFKNISTLAPATISIISSKGGQRSYQYWDFNFRDELTLNRNDTGNKLQELFQESVKRQLCSDVEVGSYLSGGMDSGSITAVAGQYLPNIKTFTGGFDLSSASGMELGFDERRAAEAMSYHFKTEHYQMVLKAGDMERCLKELVWHLEEPRVGQSYPNYYMAGLASRFVKVVLGGTGGDELFAGYPWRYYRNIETQTNDGFSNDYFNYWQRLLDNSSLSQVLSPIKNEIMDFSALDTFKSVLQKFDSNVDGPKDAINQSLYFEAKTFLVGLLTVEDKLSMAHSLESRVPFLDNDLVDFSSRIPLKFKLKKWDITERFDENIPGHKSERFYENQKDGKLILREIMKNYIPQEILNRPKQGFSAPDASWFRGDSIEFVKRVIKNKQARIYDLMDYNSISNLVDEHLSGQKNRRLLIWSLLYLETFFEVFF